jgi:hypothetical protein
MPPKDGAGACESFGAFLFPGEAQTPEGRARGFGKVRVGGSQSGFQCRTRRGIAYRTQSFGGGATDIERVRLVCQRRDQRLNTRAAANLSQSLSGGTHREIVFTFL